MSRKNPADSARLALGKVLGQLDKARQRVAELEAVVSELSDSLSGKAKVVLPKATLPPIEEGPAVDLDDNDNLGNGRWV